MQGKTLRHFWYYFAFICVELSGLFGVYYFAYDKFIQIIVVSLMALFYMAWAIIHHAIHHDLHVKVVVEYILIGILGVLVVLFFINL